MNKMTGHAPTKREVSVSTSKVKRSEVKHWVVSVLFCLVHASTLPCVFESVWRALLEPEARTFPCNTSVAVLKSRMQAEPMMQSTRLPGANLYNFKDFHSHLGWDFKGLAYVGTAICFTGCGTFKLQPCKTVNRFHATAPGDSNTKTRRDPTNMNPQNTSGFVHSHSVSILIRLNGFQAWHHCIHTCRVQALHIVCYNACASLQQCMTYIILLI